MDTNKKIINFIRKLYNTDKSIFLHEPVFVGNEKKYLNNCIDTTFVSSVGQYVDKFEDEFSKIIDSNGTVATVNGTSALQVALRVVGVLPGDEVITQSLTFVATANSIIYNQANPVFIDVDYQTMGMSANALENFLEKNAFIKNYSSYNQKTKKRIAACLPMHTFGFSCEIDKIVEICDKWHIPVVEDAAEALGSKFKGKSIGTFGKAAAFSFNGNKIITSGGGGCIVSNDKKILERAKFLTTTAKEKHKYEFIHNEIGFNYRMPNINAALACAQIEKLSFFLKKKLTLHFKYSDFFKKIGVKYRTDNENSKSNYWLNCIEFENSNQKSEFLNFSNANGVMTRPVWKLMHKLPQFKKYYSDNQLNAIKLENTIVNIPSSVNFNS